MFLINFNLRKCACVGINNRVILLRARYKSNHGYPVFSISPITGPRCPQDSRKLSFPDYMTMAQNGGKVVSITHRPFLPPGNTPGTHFC